MPTKREREYYAAGYRDGISAGLRDIRGEMPPPFSGEPYGLGPSAEVSVGVKRQKRKLSAWNKFVKANSKKPRFRYRNGKLNLKKMAVAFRKTPAGKKKRK